MNSILSYNCHHPQCYWCQFWLLLRLSSSSSLSRLCTVFTTTHLQQTTFLWYIYSVAAVLYLQSVLHVMLFPLFNMFCTFTSALPAVCSAQYGCFLQLLNFLLSRYVAQVLSEWFWNGSSRPYCHQYHFCMYSPYVLNFYCTVFILFQYFLSSLLDHSFLSRNCNIN